MINRSSLKICWEVAYVSFMILFLCYLYKDFQDKTRDSRPDSQAGTISLISRSAIGPAKHDRWCDYAYFEDSELIAIVPRVDMASVGQVWCVKLTNNAPATCDGRTTGHKEYILKYRMD
jgi:hypothetical protein